MATQAGESAVAMQVGGATGGPATPPGGKNAHTPATVQVATSIVAGTGVDAAAAGHFCFCCFKVSKMPRV